MGKKSSQKSAKKVFLYSHEYSDQKMRGEKKRETIFPETQMVQEKMLRKNRRKKEGKTYFIFTRLS